MSPREWGIAHPKPLLEGGAHEGDSPNIVALTLVVSMLHQLNEELGVRVRAFIHDEQNQFAKHLEEFHAHSKAFTLDTSNICAPFPVVKAALTFGCELEVGRSSDRLGLQLIDTVLWLVKRFIDLQGHIYGDAGLLASHVIAHAGVSLFDRKTMVRDVVDIHDQIMALPLTEKQLAKGRKLFAEIEAKRIERMNRPFEE
jgi:hypothetical protein